MATDAEYEAARERTVEMLSEAGVALTDEERGDVEIVDYGFDDLETVGTEIVVYVNNDRYCAKDVFNDPKSTGWPEATERIERTRPYAGRTRTPAVSPGVTVRFRPCLSADTLAASLDGIV